MRIWSALLHLAADVPCPEPMEKQETRSGPVPHCCCHGPGVFLLLSGQSGRIGGRRGGAALFSPLNDRVLPEADGLYLGGGYPELYLSRLSKTRPCGKAFGAR